MNASSLIPRYLQTLTRACETAPALDLACGSGRNGLYLLSHGVPVIFADRDGERLEMIDRQLQSRPFAEFKHDGSTWKVDFEIPGNRPLQTESFGAILVFRYLHRPLLADIQAALIPGGLLIYETFTVQQATLGRPRNPDFLLRNGELQESFSQLRILHEFEGIDHDPDSGEPRAIAQLVAEKPAAGSGRRTGSREQ